MWSFQNYPCKIVFVLAGRYYNFMTIRCSFKNPIGLATKIQTKLNYKSKKFNLKMEKVYFSSEPR